MDKDTILYATVDEQIEKLKKQGLIISNLDFARSELALYGYSNLIKSYRDPYTIMSEECSKKYRSGVTFEQIQSLYILDKNLRNAVMASMLDLEEYVKEAAADVIAYKYGTNQNDYLQYRNYVNKKKRKQRIKETAYEVYNIKAIPQELEYRIENSKEQKIKTYDYFISLSSVDYESVQRLITLLNKDNKNVYCDWKADNNYLKRRLVCKATQNVINKRIEQSKKILFVDSDTSRNSCWVKYELNYADQRGKEILVLRKDSIDNSNICLMALNDKWFIDSNYENILQL